MFWAEARTRDERNKRERLERQEREQKERRARDDQQRRDNWAMVAAIGPEA